jgi:shikimate dehydrogenase
VQQSAYNRGVPAPEFPIPIGGSTRYCAVYGYPVRHSASPAMQNAGLAALGLDWRYLAFQVHPDHLRAAIAGAKAMNFVGLNLTVPHKLLAMEMVEVLDESARTWGAVNTIRFETQTADKTWQGISGFEQVPQQVRAHGFNTDADAIVRALQEDLALNCAGAKVLLLGAGGAGRTAALKLASEGAAELWLVNRTESKAQKVAQEIHQRFPAVKARIGFPKTAVELILNATSLGLKTGDPSPLSPSDFALGRAKAVYDMIYRPAETRLLQEAKQAGCRVANGLGMLLYQGVKALEIWTGQSAPLAIMRHALEQNVYGSAAAKDAT